MKGKASGKAAASTASATGGAAATTGQAKQVQKAKAIGGETGGNPQEVSITLKIFEIHNNQKDPK